MKKPLLKFKEESKDKYEKPVYGVYNHENVFLGTITRNRVGSFMHWVFNPDGDTFYTNGCLKEIVEFITNLYGKKE